MVCTTRTYTNRHLNNWDHTRSYHHHKGRIYKLCASEDRGNHKRKFHHFLFKNNKHSGLQTAHTRYKVRIVPSLDRRLFSINSFLANGNNCVHFENNFI